MQALLVSAVRGRSLVAFPPTGMITQFCLVNSYRLLEVRIYRSKPINLDFKESN
jgi:hypothetical protein